MRAILDWFPNALRKGILHAIASASRYIRHNWHKRFSNSGHSPALSGSFLRKMVKDLRNLAFFPRAANVKIHKMEGW